jgi:hypothetical protein
LHTALSISGRFNAGYTLSGFSTDKEIQSVMSEKTVKRFADSETIYEGSSPVKGQKDTHWIEYTDGTIKTATEGTIMSLWNHWVVAENVSKKSENGFTVFEYNDR